MIRYILIQELAHTTNTYLSLSFMIVNQLLQAVTLVINSVLVSDKLGTTSIKLN